MTIRKGRKVKYIGNKDLMKGHVYTVEKRTGNWITIYAPIRYLGGDVHHQKVSMHINDFELWED